MGIENKTGSIAVGKDADLILFDDNIEIKDIILRGNLIKNKI